MRVRLVLACTIALLAGATVEWCRATAATAIATGTLSARDIYWTTSKSHGPSRTASHLRSVQFDDNDDGVGGCVNECKLKLEICLGQRPDGEPPDRCEKLEDDCENACYNSGPDAGDNT
jgi:hypothetical protein